MKSAPASIPRMLRVAQSFPVSAKVDIESTVAAEFTKIQPPIKPGTRIAVATGSRGITHIDRIVKAIIDQLKARGAVPFILPAMGSHGGATSEGQTQVIADYGISETTMGVAVRATMETSQVGTTPQGAPVFCSVEALGADGVIVVNRVKPHTDFQGTLGSGLIKMLVIGLGKHRGAAAMHQSASWHGYETALRAAARVILDRAPIIGGFAIIENQQHQTARLEFVGQSEIEGREIILLEESRGYMPRLPFDEIDLLIVDRLGKNISGAGMDPNVTGRWVHGYSTELARNERPSPFVRRLFARDLTAETHGNAIGIGAADFTTSRLLAAMDKHATYINSLTALTPNGAKMPMHFDSDREAIQTALGSVAMPDPSRAAVVRIRDTLSLDLLEISESLLERISGKLALRQLSKPSHWNFDADGHLADLTPGE